MPDRIDILLAGYGTVGTAFHRAVQNHRDIIKGQYGLDVRVTTIARSTRLLHRPGGIEATEENGYSWDRGELMDRIWETDADVLVEATPTDLEDGQPALGHVRTALHNELPVVLANKGPVAHGYPDIQERAGEADVPVRFEATVAGCVPTFNVARHAFSGDRIHRVEGILNGTTNFILSRMGQEGSGLDQALREAQAMGYAETDPSADLDGLDAAAKVVILSNALLDRELTLDDVDVEGIRDVTPTAVKVAQDHGMRVKLVGLATREGSPSVRPRLVPEGSTLDVPGALNAVRFSAELAGSVTHTGEGAGGSATAAALLSDVVQVGRASRA